MGFYIRKSFRAGPIRLNLSKSGFGTSIGVKGFRVGTSASGRSYVHAGRGGLYYRQTLSPAKKTRSQSTSSSGIGIFYIIIVVVGLFITVKMFQWMTQNPGIVIASGLTLIMIVSFYFYGKARKAMKYEEYKKMLDDHFVLSEKSLDDGKLKKIAASRQLLTKYQDLMPKVHELERTVYTAVLDKIVDDKKITDTERLSIQQLESVAIFDEDFKKKSKRDIFGLLYLDIIADRQISDDEVAIINNYVSGLGLIESDVRNEIRIIKEIIRVQKLSLPLTPVENVPVKTQKVETAYYTGKGKIMSRKKIRKGSDTDFEYNVRNNGKFVITDKRILVVGEDTTRINLKDILDIDVDLDNSMIVLSKRTTSTPTFLQTDEPLYSAKIIDLLTG